MMFDPFAYLPRVRQPLRLNAERVLEGLGGGLGGRWGASAPLSPEQLRRAFAPPVAPGAPEGVRLAMDAALEAGGLYSQLAAVGDVDAPAFPGYPALSRLAQNGLIRAGVETVADDMTRAWMELRHRGENRVSDRAPAVLEALERLDARAVFADAAAKTGYFGGCLVYLDMGDADDETLRLPLHPDPATAPVGGLRRLTVVEPVNVYPGMYNASDPLRPDYFRPRTWWVQGREVHSSRFLYFAANVPPLLLRPAYNFFGIGMAQVAWDYALHFTETREAAARLLTKFSLTALKTNMAEVMQGGGRQSLDTRVEFFARYRDNNGIMTLDNDTEDLIQLNTPLAGVDAIVRQALELLAAIFRIPAVKLLGISPSGFNATGESDLRNYYDHVAAQQRKLFDGPLARLLPLVQLSTCGAVDPGLTWAFAPLTAEDGRVTADLARARADIDAAYLDRGVLTPEEIRTRLAADPGSGYDALQARSGLTRGGADASLRRRALP